jgi:2-polyprenyl-3-methyl-5-hydroxy-6-metoxy-1,4-benzoquinol methylase
MDKTGIGSDAISLEGYISLESVIESHIRTSPHILLRDTPEMMFDVKTRVDFYDIFKYVNKETKLLDMGCGKGLFTLYLSDYVKEAVGIDYNRENIKIATSFSLMKKKKCKFINTSFDEYFSNNRTFDFILLLAVFDHILKDNSNLNDKKLIDICKNKINKNGYLLIESGPIYTEVNKLPSKDYETNWMETIYKTLKNDNELEEIYTKPSREKRILHLFKKI